MIKKEYHPSKIEGFVIPLEIVSKNGNEYDFNAIQFYDSKFSKEIALFCQKHSIEFIDQNIEKKPLRH